MSQSVTNPSATTINRTDSTKQSTDSLRPHYFTTFQNYCCGPKANSTTTTTTTPNKDLLPIPEKFKNEAETLLSIFNEVLIEDLDRVAKYTSIIPNLFFEKNDNFQIQKYLIDRTMQRTLKDADIINWISDLKPLYPIRTSGNGNCLLHAVLIAMIGIHDFNLNLRDRLGQFMNNNKEILKTHWKIEKLKIDKSYGISSEDTKLDDEWKELCDCVHYENSDDGQAATNLQFLEAVHIFSISNMLRRPIIVLSEDVIRNKVGEAISVNDLFGIYLPILSSPNECINEPIVLAYDRSHFCPLQMSDINSDKTTKNILPLYPSVNHTLEQTLLPIRFLGDDINVERSNNLLREYLRIVNINFNWDSKSDAIPIQCAELGTKFLSLKENFFLLYHKYVSDFFEIQKPKAIEEERQRQKQRELDEYLSRQTSYDTYNRSTGRTDISPTRSPQSNNTPLRTQNTRIYDQQYSHDDDHNNQAYIPSNGSISLEYFRTPARQSETLPSYTRTITPRDSNFDDSYYRTVKQQSSTSNSENINNLNNDGKMINSVHIDIQGTDRNYNPERPKSTRFEIPVQVTKSNVPSADPNLTIYERGRASTDKCLMCNRLFDDVYLKHFCPKCDARIQNAKPDDEISSRPSTGTRSRTTNLYMPTYDHRYSSVLSPTPKTRPLQKIICPHCKNPNLLQNLTVHSDYHCSACQNPIPFSYR